jgi:uncharacterized membrane protein (DUF485 family)
LGRGPKPPHERTAREDGDPVDWDRLAASPAFKALVARKKRFILPACVFFIAYYFSLPVLVGFFPSLMATKVWGQVNLAYLFALSQFFMAWALAALYVREASHHDREAHAIATSRRILPLDLAPAHPNRRPRRVASAEGGKSR